MGGQERTLNLVDCRTLLYERVEAKADLKGQPDSRKTELC